MNAAALGLVLALAFVPAHAAPPLPQAVDAEVRGLKPQGEFRFRFLLLHVYDAALWTPGAFSFEAPFALDIRYAMAVRGRDLAQRSLEEMRRQGHRDEARLARWGHEMRRVFPDIASGDRLVGVYLPGVGARFFDARQEIGTVADPAFARAFFDIWLAPATSEPAMRQALLAGPAP
jgi:hypothetical protein